MDEKIWELHGHIMTVLGGVNKRGQEYQMISVAGHKFWLEPEHRNGFNEGDEVVVTGRFIRDIRTANGFEAVQEIVSVNKLNVPTIKAVKPA